LSLSQKAAPLAMVKKPLTILREMYTGSSPAVSNDRRYRLITGLPLKPFYERETKRYDIGDGIWTFEQEQVSSHCCQAFKLLLFATAAASPVAIQHFCP
jgi:hypothetical protein